MHKLQDYFIEPEHAIDREAFQPASYLRRTFVLDKSVQHAQLHITACGLYQGFINGRPVTDERFTPGFTLYTQRLQVQTYDVTDLLVTGSNMIGVILGDGWYRGQLGIRSRRYFYGEKIRLAAALLITFTDGTQMTLPTDTSWKSTQDGPIRRNDWKDGEVYDARRELVGWLKPDYDDSAWQAVQPSAYPGMLVPSEGEAILEHERFTPDVMTTPDGSTLLDFKQNLFGYVEFSVTGPEGHTVKLRHGETLDENGNFTMDNLTLNVMSMKVGDELLQEVHYTLKEGLQQYKPTLTAHGFRYVKVDNWPEAVRPENFTAIAVYSDLKQIGHFDCSHPGINQLVQNTLWSQKGNFVDIPTDCPTRERAGWTGDIAAFCETGSYLMYTYRFLAKWLKDLALQQDNDGRVPNIVPDVGMSQTLNGSAGWGDAAVIVPYTLYRMYGDQSILTDQYDSMKKWLAFVERRAQDSGMLNRLRRNPYNRYLVDTGYHWGEWLEPGQVMAIDAFRKIFLPDAEVATAYFAYSSGLLSEIADVLGKPEDAAYYRSLSDHAKAAYCYTFTDDGLVHSNRQARYVRPVALDLLPEAHKVRNVERLNQMVIANRYRIGTGFLTTPFILSVLSDYGYVDTAYRMVQNTERPGWLYAISKGATTIWENWNGIDDRGVPRDSLNHYAFGAVTGWFFTRVAGITPLAPGFSKIRLKPTPGGDLRYANCSYQSTAGPITSAWRIEGNTFTLEIDVPAETEVHLPDGTQCPVDAGQHTFSCRYP